MRFEIAVDDTFVVPIPTLAKANVHWLNFISQFLLRLILSLLLNVFRAGQSNVEFHIAPAPKTVH